MCRDALRRTAGGASFGWERTTLARSAAQWAAPGLASRGIAPVGRLPLEALAARVVHRMGARAAWALQRDGGPARLRARHRPLLRGVAHGQLSRRRHRRSCLDALLAAFEAELTTAALADRALVFGEAARAVREGAVAAAPLLLVNLALVSTLEANLVAALAAASDDVLVTLPTGDTRTLALLQAAIVDAVVQDVAAEGPVASLQNALFSEAAREAATSSGVDIFSAPGESRECVGIARRVQSEAAAGTPFTQSHRCRAPRTDRLPGPPRGGVSSRRHSRSLLTWDSQARPRRWSLSRCSPALPRACRRVIRRIPLAR